MLTCVILGYNLLMQWVIFLFFLIILVLAVCIVLLLLRILSPNRLVELRFREELELQLDKIKINMTDEFSRQRLESLTMSKAVREELQISTKSSTDSLLSRLGEIAILQKNQLDTFSKQLNALTQSNEQRLDRLREVLENRLKLLQEENSQKLEQMRATVDEKLHATLEKRLGESFKLVSERLELVHKGLGEMQSLAANVGDLKKVLTNVKTRGTWGEIQLGSLLEQLLTKEQYAANVCTKKGSADRVEFAIKLPGRDVSGNPVWLPIDAKFPQEDYQRFIEALDNSRVTEAAEAAKQLELRIKSEAKDIRDKYLDPPHTTDFGILFLPVEGLYAEIVRRSELVETLQRDYRVIVTGPTTLAALLNSLQMGFRTLAIEKRSSEVWSLLGAVKTDFGKFGDMLDKTHKKLQEASHTIEFASKKSRTIENKLRNVQELPREDSSAVLAIVDNVAEESLEGV